MRRGRNSASASPPHHNATPLWCRTPELLRLVLLRSRRSRRVVRWWFRYRMHRLQERDDRVDLRRSEVLAVGRHVAAALHDLAYDLVVGEPRGGVVQGRAAQSAL